MMWGYGMGMGLGWGLGATLTTLVFWCAIIVLAVWAARTIVNSRQVGRAVSALEVLRRRFASGELTREDFEQMRRTLEG